MNIKTYFIILLFFNYYSVHGMEGVDSQQGEKGDKTKRTDLSLPVVVSRVLGASTPKKSYRDDNKTTPRDFQELSELVKSQKTLPSRIKKIQSSDSVVIESGDDSDSN